MVDWTKPIQTRNGLKAELIRKLDNSNLPYVVVVTGSESQYVEQYMENGRIYSTVDCVDDIINAPVKIVRWVVTGDATGYDTHIFHTKEGATSFRDMRYKNTGVVHKVVLTR